MLFFRNFAPNFANLYQNVYRQNFGDRPIGKSVKFYVRQDFFLIFTIFLVCTKKILFLKSGIFFLLQGIGVCHRERVCAARTFFFQKLPFYQNHFYSLKATLISYGHGRIQQKHFFTSLTIYSTCKNMNFAIFAHISETIRA